MQVKSGILSGFLELDEKLRKIPEVANGEDKSGTTAVCVLITEKYVIFSNCGDSRGVLSGKTGSGNDATASRYIFWYFTTIVNVLNIKNYMATY